jgi:two-component system response regulator MtrA
VDGRVARKNGTELPLTALEFDLLAAFLQRPGTVLTRHQLLERCWDGHYGDVRVVDVHVANLRKKIEDDPAQPRLLRTVRGAGYKLIAS